MDTPQTQLNRVELTGYVGAVNRGQHNGRSFARLSVATNYAFRDRDNCPCIETTWHDCTAWEGPHISSAVLDALAKGDCVHLTGRLRTRRITDAHGHDRSTTEVAVASLEILHPDRTLMMEE